MFDYSKAIHKDFGSYKIQNDIIIAPFWTEEFCKQIVEVCELHSKRFLINRDPFYFTEEMPVSKLSPIFLEDFALHLKSFLPILSKDWLFLDAEVVGLDSPYIIRYRKDGRREINLHCDNSVISFYIKLNDDYTGCNLEFPKQNFNVKDVYVGHAIIWPGAVTHPHRTDSKLIDGVKYSFTAFCKGADHNFPRYDPVFGYNFK